VDENGEIKRDPNTGMAVVVNQGEPGHLLGKVQKRREFVGYTDREASKKKLVHNVTEKGDTYFLSGDLLVESDGFYWWYDRVGDTFRWKGENISTTEVENVIALAHLHGIVDAVVYGVRIPWQDDGTAGMAKIIVRAGTRSVGFERSLQALRVMMEKHLPNYSIPLFVRIHILPSDSSCNSERNTITQTFKHQKASLRKAGFDPALCGPDSLYYWNKVSRLYAPMTNFEYMRISKENHWF